MHKSNRLDRVGSARVGLFRPGSVVLKPHDYGQPGYDDTGHRDRFHEFDHYDFHLDDNIDNDGVDNEPG